MPMTVLPTLAAPDQVSDGWRLPAMADPCPDGSGQAASRPDNAGASPCPSHPEILLPRASRVLCPICAQDRRRASYAAQLVQWQSSSSRPRTMPGDPVQGARRAWSEAGKVSAPAATAGDLHNDE
jgi:hypothetical protein